MRYVTWFVVCFAFCPLLNAQMTLDSESVKKMVVFIYGADADGNLEKGHPMGTGFLIAPYRLFRRQQEFRFKGVKDSNGQLHWTFVS